MFALHALIFTYIIWQTHTDISFIFFQVYCNEASNRIAENLGALKNSTQLGNFKLMEEISKTVCENENVLQGNPLGL